MNAEQAAFAAAFGLLLMDESMLPALATLRPRGARLATFAKNQVVRGELDGLTCGCGPTEQQVFRFCLGAVAAAGPKKWTTENGLTLRPKVVQGTRAFGCDFARLGLSRTEIPRRLAAARIALACFDAGLPITDTATLFEAMVPLKAVSEAKILWAELIGKSPGVPTVDDVQRAVVRKLEAGEGTRGFSFRVEGARVRERLRVYLELLPKPGDLQPLLQSDLTDLEARRGAWFPPPKVQEPAAPTAPAEVVTSAATAVPPAAPIVTHGPGFVWIRNGRHVQCGVVAANHERPHRLTEFVKHQGGRMLPSSLPGTEGPAGEITFASEGAAKVFRKILEIYLTEKILPAGAGPALP